MSNRCTQRNTERGLTLLVAVLVVGIVLAIGLSILNVTLKEYILSGIARESTIALNAADAGMECAMYWDHSVEGATEPGGMFHPGPPGSRKIICMGTTRNISQGPDHNGRVDYGEDQNFTFEWPESDPQVCSKIIVTKYFSASASVPMPGYADPCPAGIVCTRVIARGYNVGDCSDSGLEESPRVVERGLRARF